MSAADRAAIAWEVHLREGNLRAAELADFDHWRSDASNARAWEALQARLARLRPREAVRRAAVAEALRVPSEKRRRLLRAGFGGAAVLLGSLALHDSVRRLGLDADWHSAIGERRTVQLADGSRMTIDAGSRIYRASPRNDLALRVSVGQVLLHAPASRAGVLRQIETEHGTVMTDGGELNVGRIHRHSVVAVGKGEAMLYQRGARPLAVSAGESVAFAHEGARRLAQPFELVSAWTRGLFVADDISLEALVDVFNRYDDGLIRVVGPAAQARVSGVFLLRDIPGSLVQVAENTPVELTRVGDYLRVLS
ncbi:FecR family protein [Paraburkholderia sp. BCC1886]|uniref:FecR family protein n=1 Tax=Paraburkholderia sp. BCC1886 TaxID=2562670 RepID=UPI0016429095|nr:FecR domain-containing protein [Paraburkholderia sp. BCC1886]